MKDVFSTTTTHLVPTNEEYQLGNDKKLVCSAQVRLSQQAPLYIHIANFRCLKDIDYKHINVFILTTHPPDNSISIFSPVSGNFSGCDTKKE